ncbi:MAG: hypothetical protein KKD44_22260 [Proteobacteria bacterium]|nr:hypothetical protein [Pseudomonadota bacterium]
MIKNILLIIIMTTVLSVNAMAQDDRKIPDLKGAWEGTAQMHYKEHGHMKPEGKVTELVVESQEGQMFHGHHSWKHKISGKDTFSGVIDNDGITFYMVGHEEGIYIGKFENADTFTLYILKPSGKSPRAGLASYKRVKH